MTWNKKRLSLVAAAVLALSLVGFTILHKTPTGQDSSTNASYNNISDSSIGLSFNMSKKFEPISKEELASMNPGFTYGFKAASDPNAVCIVSTTKLISSGTITPEQLRDGILGEIGKVHPDITLDNTSSVLNPVKFGEAQGILLQATYTDGAAKVKRVEAIALGKVNEVIAYCQSLAADNAKYYPDFTTFFSSLKLTQ